MTISEVKIHPTAYVEDGATLGAGVEIGPFCHIGADVQLGENVQVLSHASVIGFTEVGAGTKIYQNAIIGGDPQNVAYKGEKTTLKVGKNNIIREGVTMHRGTGNARGETRVGDNCMILAYVHVSHDTFIGNNVTLANNVLLGGHCTIGDRVIFGAGAGIHQFCTVGHHAFIGGLAAVVNDVIPYGMVVGNRAYLAGLNLVGMKRSGMAREDIHAVRRVYRELFGGEGTLRENATRLKPDYTSCEAALDILNFLDGDANRSFITPNTALRSRGNEGL